MRVLPEALKILLNEDAIRAEQGTEKTNRILSLLESISTDVKLIKQPEELLEIKDVCRIVKFSHDWVYKKIREGDFPPPTKISTSSRWYRSEIDQWMESQKSYRVN